MTECEKCGRMIGDDEVCESCREGGTLGRFGFQRRGWPIDLRVAQAEIRRARAESDRLLASLD